MRYRLILLPCRRLDRIGEWPPDILLQWRLSSWLRSSCPCQWYLLHGGRSSLDWSSCVHVWLEELPAGGPLMLKILHRGRRRHPWPMLCDSNRWRDKGCTWCLPAALWNEQWSGGRMWSLLRLKTCRESSQARSIANPGQQCHCGDQTTAAGTKQSPCHWLPHEGLVGLAHEIKMRSRLARLGRVRQSPGMLPAVCLGSGTDDWLLWVEA